VPYDLNNGDDLFDVSCLRRKLAGCDVVLHMAAHAHRGISSEWEPFKRLNLEGTKAVYSAARRIKSVERFVYISTGNVYCLEDGFRSDVRPPVSVNDLPDPEQAPPYPRSKILAERWLAERATTGGPEVLVLRPNWIGTSGGKPYFEASCPVPVLVEGIVRACVGDFPIPGRFLVLDLIAPNENYVSVPLMLKTLFPEGMPQ
jgi:nucleoside-diphosphate-sugar epimerase